MKIISDILKGHTINLKKKKKFLDKSNVSYVFLEQIKKKSIENFLIDLDNKNRQMQINAFKKNITDYEKNIEAFLQAKSIELKSYIDKYNQLLEENRILRLKLSIVNKENQKIESTLDNHNKEYLSMQMTLNKFEKHIKLVDHIIEFSKSKFSSNVVDFLIEYLSKNNFYLTSVILERFFHY